MNDEPVGRRRPVHFPPLASRHGDAILFVTVCTAGRRSLLACPASHQHLRETWVSTTDWLLGRYVLMPDHLHFFCSPGALSPPPLKAWMEFWKSLSAARWPGPAIGPVWQRDFWDTQMRSAKHYEDKWEYVRANPVRAGLVTKPEEWRYQGAEYDFVVEPRVRIPVFLYGLGPRGGGPSTYDQPEGNPQGVPIGCRSWRDGLRAVHRGSGFRPLRAHPDLRATA